VFSDKRKRGGARGWGGIPSFKARKPEAFADKKGEKLLTKIKGVPV